jgi:small membrane protein
MTLIQLLLLVFLFAAFVLYWRLFQNRFLNRLVLLVAFLVMGFFVVKPAVSTRIANWLGVGRGTDLIFYLSIVILIFVLLMMYSKIKKLEEMVTSLLRSQALNESNKENGV